MSFGDWTDFAGSKIKIKMIGLCQSNGATPAVWCMISIAVLWVHKVKGHGSHFFAPISMISQHLAAILYVDDTDLFISTCLMMRLCLRCVLCYSKVCLIGVGFSLQWAVHSSHLSTFSLDWFCMVQAGRLALNTVRMKAYPSLSKCQMVWWCWLSTVLLTRHRKHWVW